MRTRPRHGFLLSSSLALLAPLLSSCGGGKAHAGVDSDRVAVGVVRISKKPLERTLTLSSELVPFQEIDVYAKESGFVKELLVDYGTRVKANQLLATLEIPELQSELRQDDAIIKNANDHIERARNELSRVEAQHKVLKLEYQRLAGVAQTKPGLVAQQEVDEAEGRSLASAAQVEAEKSTLQAAESELTAAQAKRERDQVLFDYSRITAPFAGVVTQRYANLGTLMQAGTTSSTQAIPLVRLSQDDRFRLVIPVPESYVRYIRIGDPVEVSVPALSRGFPGKVARFAIDVRQDTRTMHTEVDVENKDRVLLPGLYAEATITLDRKEAALSLPLQALTQEKGEAWVLVVDAGRKVERRRVALGIQTPTDVEVLSGLKEGEEVVVSDRSGLKPGEDVRPQPVDLVQYQPAEDQK